MSARTLFDKVWDAHVVERGSDDVPDLLYIDLHLLHEVTSPQAFEGLRLAGRSVRRPDRTLATVDHAIPTSDRHLPIVDDTARIQVDTLRRNVAAHAIPFHDVTSPGQGIVHVIGPEQGHTLPGMTIVCGDSHTSTHGAFGAFALGIGTSQVEHVLATQCLRLERPGTMAVTLEGGLPAGVTAKDLILAVIGRIGVAGGRGRVLEYRGAAIRDLDMEERMTVCNMSIEAGARAGMIAPDETTFAYLRGRPAAPRGDDFDDAVHAWRALPSDPDARHDAEVVIDAAGLAPMVTWGTTPAMSVPIDGRVPDLPPHDRPAERDAALRALEYMDLAPGRPLEGLAIDRVFIGSCTNGRLSDLRAAARMVEGRRVRRGVRAMVVPGSTAVRAAAEEEGLGEIFRSAGFEWREAGCSMCLGMNPDVLGPGERCASTSNRNFEGRQGRGGRTHLVSPAMAAAAAVEGALVDIRTAGGI